MKSRRVQRRVFRVPMVPDKPRDLLRIASPAAADFVSQQLVEPRPAAAGEAVTAYDRGARIAVRRMPAGYRTTIVT
ncbi:hypothetical protein [Devosia sp. CN2-171]|uniref:hypothetical protein n=1 Tax=Devosia sp. CN2-171 TaxID=3400909 RepID=UPI003BF89CAF